MKEFLCLGFIFGAVYLLISEKTYDQRNCIAYYGAECQEKLYDAPKDKVIMSGDIMFPKIKKTTWDETHNDAFKKTYYHIRAYK